MKKIKLLKSMLLLFTVFTLTSCEEDGAIEFLVVDEFTTEVSIVGLEGSKAYTSTEVTDISDLLEDANRFIEANVESVTYTLKNYSGTSITGTMKLTIGGDVKIDQTVVLSATPLTIPIPTGSQDILADINSGEFSFSLEGTTTEAIEDNDFVIVVTSKIQGKI